MMKVRLWTVLFSRDWDLLKGPGENTGVPFIKDLPEQETDPIPQDNFQEEENKEPSVESSLSCKGGTLTGREEEKTLSELESLPHKFPIHQENVSTTEQTKRDLFDQNKTRETHKDG